LSKKQLLINLKVYLLIGRIPNSLQTIEMLQTETGWERDREKVCAIS